MCQPLRVITLSRPAIMRPTNDGYEKAINSLYLNRKHVINISDAKRNILMQWQASC